jgi:hypothetical protein
MGRHSGFAELPLHGGRAPAWLFERMVRLSREIVTRLAADSGPADVLRRLFDPFWFQAFGCVLGFDWHSSGVTTTVCGAVKEGLRGLDGDLGFFVAGGKGGTSRKTPHDIEDACERLGRDPVPLVHASRIAAKVDSAAVQDGYQLYHHAFFFTKAGDWCVVQQGLSDQTSTARRYHWLSETVRSFVDERHAAVWCDHQGATLNLVASDSAATRQASARLAAERPAVVLGAVAQATPTLVMPARHPLFPETDVADRRLYKTLLGTYEQPPADFEALVGRAGVGPRTLRALALASELIYGAAPSTRDPARYAFAHGGKDGTPFPVDRETYDRTIEVLETAINRAKVDRSERVAAFRRLATGREEATP